MTLVPQNASSQAGKINIMETNSISQVLVWFDIFDWPLSWLEIEKYSRTENFEKFSKNISYPIESLNGFYFLKGREEIVKKRILRQKIAIKKLKIAKRAAEILSFIPFIRMVAICNDLAYFNAPSESDIDFFIVVKQNRIWLTRFLSTITLFSLRLWRHNKKIQNRICLSFFITDDHLNLGGIAYDNDVYLKYWVLQLLPLFDREKTYQNFFRENFWITGDFPDFLQVIPVEKMRVRPKIFQIICEKILNNFLGNLLERALKWSQLKIMKKRAPFQRDKDVIISDKILKFHENDRRRYFKKLFEEKLGL